MFLLRVLLQILAIKILLLQILAIFLKYNFIEMCKGVETKESKVVDTQLLMLV